MAQNIQPDGDQMHEDIVDWDLARVIMAAVFNREGEHRSYDTEPLRHIIILEFSVFHTPDNDTDKPKLLTDLGNSLMERFKRFGNDANLVRAVSAFEDAVQLTPDDHPAKPGCLSNLGNSYIDRSQRFGDDGDIDRAISRHVDAVRHTPDDHPDKAAYLANLGSAYGVRFRRLEDVADIDRAISNHGDAAHLVKDDDPDKPVILSNLGASLLRRFKRLEDNMADIDQAILILRDAVQHDHPDRARALAHLGNSYGLRFEHLGEVADIDCAISNQEDAVQCTPDDHVDKAGRQTDLGNSYLRRFQHLGDIVDIDRAISSHGDAARCTPDDHPDKAGCLNCLGNSFATRFGRLGEVADIDSAISNHESAVGRTPDHHPDKAGNLTSLGSSFLRRFDHFGDVTDVDKAILQYELAAKSLAGAPLVRFKASLQWAECARQRGSSLLAAYCCTIDLLPRVAWLGLTVPARHEQLAKIGDVVRTAAAAAIEQEEYALALEWLEQGRSVVWGQILHLRSPVDHLRAVEPALADRLETISKQLENASTRDTSLELTSQLSSEGIAQKHRRLTAEWERLVDQIRALPGYDDFLRPKKLSQLQEAARHGPVVVINIYESRCDALVIRADLDDVVHIPLHTFSHRHAESLQRSLAAVISVPGLRARYSDRDATRVYLGVDRNPNDTLRSILSQLWEHIVKPVLDGLAFPVRDLCSMPFSHFQTPFFAQISRTDDPPRIWWCATGPLAFLPLHAAGVYENDQPGSRICDFVTSSYTPTLTALLEAPHADTSTVARFKLLSIAQPATPGHSPLPNTTEELIRIRRRAAKLSVKSLEGPEATVDRVIQGMKECSWLHLACHGTQDADNPTKSGLLLQDGRLELSRITHTPLPHAELAFLSACQTATGVKRLSEEAVHLAAGMLLAGYRGVIATTWSIMDNDAPFVADEVYAYLFKDERPDPKRAAHALHHAVQKLRKDKGVSFLSWVPFIHVGI
jgi:tetratricopeptide (TPR) repeat protein